VQKHSFLKQLAALMTIAALGLSGCTTTTSASATSGSEAKSSTRRHEIDSKVDATLPRLYSTVRGSKELIAKAHGVLIFPNVVSAGFVIGGQYGEGALREHGASTGYYSLGSVSLGLQAGAESKALIFLFMTKEALDKFRASHGWVAGADASVTVLKAGADGSVEMLPTSGPVVAMVLTNAGLMANLSVEGTKITPITD
jgi:lipid-binding SYLF domain-containing protein